MAVQSSGLTPLLCFYSWPAADMRMDASLTRACVDPHHPCHSADCKPSAINPQIPNSCSTCSSCAMKKLRNLCDSSGLSPQFACLLRTSYAYCSSSCIEHGTLPKPPPPNQCGAQITWQRLVRWHVVSSLPKLVALSLHQLNFPPPLRRSYRRIRNTEHLIPSVLRWRGRGRKWLAEIKRPKQCTFHHPSSMLAIVSEPGHPAPLLWVGRNYVDAGLLHAWASALSCSMEVRR